MISIIYHLITLLCLPIIATYSDLTPPHTTRPLSLLSCAIFATCPICYFVSQKFWIDNCSMMTVTLAIALHLYISKQNFSTQKKSSIRLFFDIAKYFVSGCFYGFFALNTKITALAAAPFLFSWIICCEHPASASAGVVARQCASPVEVLVLLKCLVFALGATIAHLPWILLYHAKTGRWLPNSWPTDDMVAASPYLQQCLSRPPYAYLANLAVFSPFCIIALIYTIVSTVKSLSLYDWNRQLNYSCSANLTVQTAFSHSSDVNNVQAESESVSKSIKSQAKQTNIDIQTAVFGLWPICFLVGLSVLGYCGAGYQTRFLLPAVPGFCVLAAAALINIFNYANNNNMTSSLMTAIMCFILLLNNCFYITYYGILFAPLYSDLNHSFLDILTTILSTLYHQPASNTEFNQILAYLAHFGVNRVSA